jgi:hypothetical protein
VSERTLGFSFWSGILMLLCTDYSALINFVCYGVLTLKMVNVQGSDEKAELIAGDDQLPRFAVSLYFDYFVHTCILSV